MFKFAHPEYLYALWAIPVLAALFHLYRRRKARALAAFAEKPLHEALFGEKSFVRETINFGVTLLAIAMLILAAANPQTGSKLEEVKQVGIDVYICLDVSRSMRAEDLKPSRLASAKNEIRMMTQRLRGDRIGLIVFAGEAFVQFPLTTDYSAAALFLSAVSTNSIGRQGTAIASAIELATKSFDEKSETKRVIVVISDGEDHEGAIDRALEKAKEKDVVVYAIGVGSESGAPIPVGNNRGAPQYKKNRQGEIVVSRLNDETLKRVAEETGGKYYAALGGTNELSEIYDDLASIEKTEYGSRKISEYDDKFFYFLAAGLLLLVVEFFLTDKRSTIVRRLLGIETKTAQDL
jgi:Ca-activated chloride channel family protein